MSLPVRVKSVADAEFAEGAVWYHRRSEKAAAAFIGAVEATFTRIGGTPEAFPIVYRTVRRAVVPSFPYAIYSPCGRRSASCWRFITESDPLVGGCGGVRANPVLQADGRTGPPLLKSRPRLHVQLRPRRGRSAPGGAPAAEH
jgi:plasmid stabilization system protein ParE